MTYVEKRCLDGITPTGDENLAKTSPTPIKNVLALGSSGLV